MWLNYTLIPKQAQSMTIEDDFINVQGLYVMCDVASVQPIDVV